MFALMLHGRFQFYTTKELADREGAAFIARKLLHCYTRCHSPVANAIKDAYNQERYSDVLELWNKMIDQDDIYLGNIFHKALVTPAEINKPFW